MTGKACRSTLDLGVVKRRRNPRRCYMAAFAQVAGRNVCCRFAGGIGAVVAGEAGRRSGIGVVEGRFPCRE